jgi:hypothetical protein
MNGWMRLMRVQLFAHSYQPPLNTIQNVTLQIALKALLERVGVSAAEEETELTTTTSSSSAKAADVVRHECQPPVPTKWDAAAGVLHCKLDSSCAPGQETKVLVRVSLAGAVRATLDQVSALPCQARMTLHGVLVSGVCTAVELAAGESRSTTIATHLRTVVVLVS